MRNIKIAAVQMSCQGSIQENISKAEQFVRQAAADGAQMILLPELFETKYFCQERSYDYYQLATTVEENAAVSHFQKVCAELKIVMPVSFFEKAAIQPLILLL